MGVADLFTFPVHWVKTKSKTTEGKTSLLLWLVLGIFYFVYFVVICNEAVLATKGNDWRIWVETNPNSRQFPQFVICPQYHEGEITGIDCKVLESKGHHNPNNPSIVYQPLTPNPNEHPDYVCYGFNMRGNVNILNQHVWCEINATNGFVTNKGNVQVFFDKVGTFEWLNCAECVMGVDNYIMPWQNEARVGIQEMSFHGLGGNRYSVQGTHYPFTPSVNYTYSSDIESFFYWNSNDVWNYQNHNYYSFWTWVGYVGGAAFLVKLCHDGLLLFLMLLFVGKPAATAEESNPILDRANVPTNYAQMRD